MKKVIQILYVPQECGDREVHIVDLSSGQVIRQYNLGDGGYSDDGLLATSKWVPVGEPFAVEYQGGRVGYIICYNGKPHYVGKIEKRKNALNIVHMIEVDEQCILSYRQSKDKFRKLLEKQGVDMANWGQPKRHDTPIQQFMREALRLKDEEVVNILVFK